jgi:hypothetical protein
MKELMKIIITLLVFPILIIGLICIIIYSLHEGIWRNKKGEADIE